MPRRTHVDTVPLDRGRLPVSPLLAPGQPDTPTPAALARLALAENPGDEGTTYDLEAARKQAAATQQAGSRSNRAGAPPMLDIIPQPHTGDASPTSPPDLQKKSALNPRLTGEEESDQKVMFEYYLAQKENRSDYEVARVFAVPLDLVARWRKKYQWDREVTALEDNDALDQLDQSNLHDLIALEMSTISGLQGNLNRSNKATAELEQMKQLPEPADKDEKRERAEKASSLRGQILSPSMLMNVVESLMTLKKAKIGQRKRKMGHLYVQADPATIEKLQREFNNRPTAPEPDMESA